MFLGNSDRTLIACRSGDFVGGSIFGFDQVQIYATKKLLGSNYYFPEALLYLVFNQKRETRLERATFTLAR
jgi:hypothetical protein